MRTAAEPGWGSSGTSLAVSATSSPNRTSVPPKTSIRLRHVRGADSTADGDLDTETSNLDTRLLAIPAEVVRPREEAAAWAHRREAAVLGTATCPQDLGRAQTLQPAERGSYSLGPT